MTWLGIDVRWAYANLLPGIARHTHCMHTARDVLHDAFVRYALAHGRTAAQPAARPRQPNAYLRRVVDAVLADHYRRSARQQPWAEPAVAIEEDEAAADAVLVPSAEDMADIRQRLALLQQIIDGLPPRCRETFWLFRIEGHTQAEIAQRLGISVNMVERHIIRAMLDLRAARDDAGAARRVSP